VKLRGILITLLLALAGVFAAVNWPTLTTTLPVNLLIRRLDAPVGLILLALTVAVALTGFLLSLLERADQLREIRTLERRLERTREKLDQQQAREMTDLKDAMRAWGESLEQRIDGRVERAEVTIQDAIDRAGEEDGRRFEQLESRVTTVRNELAADVGEAEDTLRRMLAQAAGGALPGPSDPSEQNDGGRGEGNA
jgi:uncharacterized integral membrane protein